MREPDSLSRILTIGVQSEVIVTSCLHSRRVVYPGHLDESNISSKSQNAYPRMVRVIDSFLNSAVGIKQISHATAISTANLTSRRQVKITGQVPCHAANRLPNKKPGHMRHTKRAKSHNFRAAMAEHPLLATHPATSLIRQTEVELRKEQKPPC